MESSLLEQELLEANLYLSRFRKNQDVQSLIYGLAVVFTVFGIPLGLVQAWLNNPETVVRLGIGYIALVCAIVCIGYFWGFRWKGDFEKIRSNALKLRRAGYIVYARKYPRGEWLSATEDKVPEDSEAIKFESITAFDFKNRFL